MFVFRLLMVVVVFAVHLSFKPGMNKSFYQHSFVNIYFYVYIGVLILSSLNDMVIAFISSRGTIFDKEKRKNVPKCLYLRLVIFIFEAGWAVYGCIKIFAETRDLDGSYKWLSEAIVVFNLIWVAGGFVIVGFSFDSAGRIWYKLDRKASSGKKYGSVDTVEFNKRIVDEYENSWLKTCRLLFCCTKAETARDNVLLFASKLFAEYFHSYTDLVPSDILAGIILLRQKQKYEESERVKQELKDTNSSYQQVLPGWKPLFFML